ncbi:hypothetical protein N8K70_10935 [Microbacterium betulae]|uniref:D-inositol 3-phosphate glycosyltransferase n=1 Tax=Microbacterium betulae TaxID=2981139 RepID=A0AA97I4L9_9MICO|nr:hypothetical protein [Microbacterium sp. AB]WOF21899.1 hypothetical protein N8K70_10935 [Microbacterium sp. AB]
MESASSGGRRERWLVATTEYAGLTGYTGGIGRHYAALLPALVRLGVAVDLVVFSDADPIPGARMDGVRLVSFRRTDGLGRLAVSRSRARHVREVGSGAGTGDIERG